MEKEMFLTYEGLLAFSKSFHEYVKENQLDIICYVKGESAFQNYIYKTDSASFAQYWQYANSRDFFMNAFATAENIIYPRMR